MVCCVCLQCFVDDNHSASGTKSSSSNAQLRDTVMALRLREASLVSDMNTLKRRLIELETQVCMQLSRSSALQLSVKLDKAQFSMTRIDSNNFYNNNNNIHICIAPYGRNFRGAGITSEALI